MPNGFQIGPLQPSTAGLKPRSPEEQALFDRYAESQQVLDPTWKKVIQGGVGAITGGLGLQDFQTGNKSAFNTGNALGQITSAGLPFLAYGGKLLQGESKVPQIYHGTQRLFDTFDPTKNDTSDVLGWMTHFAEDPNYARTYASGASKGIKKVSFNPAAGPIDPNELTVSGNSFYPNQAGATTINPRTIPARPKAQNVLDLVDPNPDDLSAALAALPPNKRKGMLDEFKYARTQTRDDPNEAYGLLKQDHYPRDLVKSIDPKEVPVRYLADRLKLTPEQFDKTLFDAIRYRDNGDKSWAIPSHTPIETPWGTPLTNTPRELKVFKHYQDTGAQASPTTNFRTMSQERPASFWEKFAPNSPAAVSSEMKFKNLDPSELNKMKPMASHSSEIKHTPEEWEALDKKKSQALGIPLSGELTESQISKVLKTNPSLTMEHINNYLKNGVISDKEYTLLFDALAAKGKY